MGAFFFCSDTNRRGKIGRLCTAFTLAVVGLLGAASQASALTCEIEDQPGAYAAAFDVSDGQQRYFLYKIPDGYDAANPAGHPLVLAFHGGGQSAWGFMMRPGQERMRELADVEDFILVYPQGRPLVSPAEAACPPTEQAHFLRALWGAAHCCGRAWDLAFTDELLAELTVALNVDTDRVYAVGYSNGGMFTHVLGGERSETFAAIAGVSTTVGGHAIIRGPFGVNIPLPTQVPSLPTRVPVPVMILNSELDPTIPFHGGLGDVDNLYHLSNADSFAHWWNANGCAHPVLATFLSQITDNTGAEHSAFSVSSGCDTNTATMVNVMFDSIHSNVNMNHSWPDLNTNGYDASGEIVNFLLDHSL